jgi:hypothetical protein
MATAWCGCHFAHLLNVFGFNGGDESHSTADVTLFNTAPF